MRIVKQAFQVYPVGLHVALEFPLAVHFQTDADVAGIRVQLVVRRDVAQSYARRSSFEMDATHAVDDVRHFGLFAFEVLGDEVDGLTRQIQMLDVYKPCGFFLADVLHPSRHVQSDVARCRADQQLGNVQCLALSVEIGMDR